MKKLLILTLVILTVAACSTPAEPTAEFAGEFPGIELLDVGECLEMISNGDFEGGSIEPWMYTSADILAFTSNANDGTNAAALGDNARLYQEVSIHSGANRAEVSYGWGSLQGAGSLTVSLQDTNGNVLSVLGEHPGNAGQNAEAIADVSDYIGQAVRVVFETTAGADFWIDDVSVQACGPVE